MKNVNQLFLIFLALIMCQIINVSSAFSQTTIENETQTKCERCAEYLSTNNMTDYGAENCRVYRMVCNQLNNEPIVVGTNESTDATQISFDAGTQKSLIVFIDGFSKISYEVTPKVNVLNEDKEVISTIETDIFQQYVLYETGKLNVAGKSKIQKLGNEKRILMTNIDVPEIEETTIYIQVEFLYYNPHTQQNEVAETLITKYNIQ